MEAWVEWEDQNPVDPALDLEVAPEVAPVVALHLQEWAVEVMAVEAMAVEAMAVEMKNMALVTVDGMVAVKSKMFGEVGIQPWTVSMCLWVRDGISQVSAAAHAFM